jgi:hypothetical protein
MTILTVLCQKPTHGFDIMNRDIMIRDILNLLTTHPLHGPFVHDEPRTSKTRQKSLNDPKG